MKIEEFIKHLESKGYEIFRKEDTYIELWKQNPWRKITRYTDTEVYKIEDYDGDLFFGKIESLEQFDLIDRLTN